VHSVVPTLANQPIGFPDFRTLGYWIFITKKKPYQLRRNLRLQQPLWMLTRDFNFFKFCFPLGHASFSESYVNLIQVELTTASKSTRVTNSDLSIHIMWSPMAPKYFCVPWDEGRSTAAYPDRNSGTMAFCSHRSRGKYAWMTHEFGAERTIVSYNYWLLGWWSKNIRGADKFSQPTEDLL